MKNSFLLFFPAIFLFLSFQCRDTEENVDEEKLKTHLMNVNRILVNNEQQQIKEFIINHNWKMDSTGTGLRYMLYEKGKGKRAVMNSTVKITGKIFLLDATLCYEYKKDSPLEFSIGRKDVPRGFEEAALLMKEDDKARFVIPAHLSFGLLGDKEHIPGNAVLFAEFELWEVNSNATGKNIHN